MLLDFILCGEIKYISVNRVPFTRKSINVYLFQLPVKALITIESWNISDYICPSGHEG